MNPTRAARQADATCAELDQIWALLAGGPTVKDRNAHYAQLRRRIHAVISRDNISAGIDGYKSRHGATDGGGNSEHTAVEAAALRLVEGGMPSDIVHAKVTLIVANVRQARDRMVGIDNGLRLIPEQTQPQDDSTWCASCLAHGVVNPRAIGNRGRHCKWCQDFRSSYGIDPPKELILKRADGKQRLTEADINACVPAAARERALARRRATAAAKDQDTAINWAHGAKTSARLVDDLPPSAA